MYFVEVRYCKTKLDLHVHSLQYIGAHFTQYSDAVVILCLSLGRQPAAHVQHTSGDVPDHVIWRRERFSPNRIPVC